MKWHRLKSQWKGYKGQGPGDTRIRFQLSSLSGVAQAALSSPSDDVWQHIRSVVNQTLTSQSLGVQGFIRPWSQRCVWLPLQRISVSRPGRGQADTTWLKAPRINHIVGIDYLAGPRPPGKERHSSQAGYCKRLERTSQECGNSWTFLHKVQGLVSPGLLSQPFTA